MRRASAIFSAVLIAVIGLSAAQAAPNNPPLPTSYAAAGDSITRAYDVNSSCFLKDCPSYSWATGSGSTIKSQVYRIQNALKSNIPNYNVAKTGAMMKDLEGQLITAAGYQPKYLTILMGANDVCTKTITGMTPTSTFKGQLQSALTTYTSRNPNGLIFISSIPNIYRLWQVLSNNSSARNAWSLFGICQSMLKSSNTEADRQVVLNQVNADNAAIAEVCGSFASTCKYDSGATFTTSFLATDISTVDYFHPSIAGHTKLAAATWAASYWPTR